MRRGSITSTRPSHQRGTSVDLPEPVGDESTTGCSVSAAKNAARIECTGSSAVNAAGLARRAVLADETRSCLPVVSRERGRILAVEGAQHLVQLALGVAQGAW